MSNFYLFSFFLVLQSLPGEMRTLHLLAYGHTVRTVRNLYLHAG